MSGPVAGSLAAFAQSLAMSGHVGATLMLPFGLTSTGPVAGGLFALVQQAVMGGAGPLGLVTLAAPIVVASTATLSLLFKGEGDAMGTANGAGHGRWMVGCERGRGNVQIFSFESEEEARAIFHKGGDTRRILLVMHPSEQEAGRFGACAQLPCAAGLAIELGHLGQNPQSDEAIRNVLRGTE